MKAKEIADGGIKALKSGKYKNVRLNFANPDMVSQNSLRQLPKPNKPYNLSKIYTDQQYLPASSECYALGLTF